MVPTATSVKEKLEKQLHAVSRKKNAFMLLYIMGVFSLLWILDFWIFERESFTFEVLNID